MNTPNGQRKAASPLLGFSPWILLLAGILLLLLLGIFGVSNYQREMELLGKSMEQRALTLVRFINSAAREGLRQRLRTEERAGWEEQMREVMEQAAEQPGVVAVRLVDPAGAILLAAGEGADSGRQLGPAAMELLGRLGQEEEQGVVSRIVDRKESGAGYRYQVAAWQVPPTLRERFPEGGHMTPGRRMAMMRRHLDQGHFQAWQEELRRLRDRSLIFVVELDFQLFSGSLQRQVLQLVLLTVVTLLVAIAGGLSYLTLKGLRGSQQRLGAMHAFTDRLVSALPIGLIATDRQGLIRLCNSSAAEILGIEGERLVGKLPQACLPPMVAGAFRGEKLAAGLPGPTEMVYDHDPKRVLILQLSTMAVYDDRQKPDGEVLLLRDLTAIRSLEKELRRSERLAALGKMAAGVAHELRNPLSSIKGLAMVLKERREKGEGGGESADLLVKEVERLNRSIGELLDYARPAKLHLGEVAPNELVGKSVSLVQADAGSLGIDIRVDVPDDLPPLSVDVDKLNQVLLNLLLNAVQAMPGGGILDITARCCNGELTLTLRDNGEGIAADDLPRIFDPYFTTKGSGTGLGLAISAKIVEEHGGAIVVDSHRGQYTEVVLTLPLSAGKVAG